MDTRYTNIRLIKVPLEIDNKNQITFDDKNKQSNYFLSLPYLEISDSSYQRKDNVIRYPMHVDELYQYNYVMYKNTTYSNKWFYAYITDYTYISDNMTELSIKTDVFQTWQFDLEYKQSFIEREHVNNDEVGVNTIPEDFETGEYICNSHSTDGNMDSLDDFTYVLSCSTIPYLPSEQGEGGKQVGGAKYNGILSGTGYFRADTKETLQGFLRDVVENGQIDSVNGVFMAPKLLTNISGGGAFSGLIPDSSSPVVYNTSKNKQTSLNGYTPKNKKLLCYPYNYLVVGNNNGEAYTYQYEMFSGNKATFRIECCLTPGCSIRMVPTNYKGATRKDDEGINLGKFPICSYPCDMYTNWLTQNSINLGNATITSDDISLIGSTTKMFGDLLTGAVASAVPGGQILGGIQMASGLTNYFTSSLSNMLSRKQHSLIPPQVRGNLNSADVVTASGKNTFHYYNMSIKKEYAKIIDDFMSIYGYQVNSVKLPNIKGRENWNYVKTTNINLHAFIPQNDLMEIKNMFNSGLTLWHNPSTFLDYSKSNNII